MPAFSRDGRRRYVLILIVLTAITLITLDQRADDKGPIGAAARVAHRIVSPIAGAADRVFSPVGDWLAGLTDGGDLRRQNRELTEALLEERAKNRDADRAIAENREYHRLTGEPWLDDIEHVWATVIAGAPGNFERTIVLNKGTESGIETGFPVVGADGLVGRVVEAWNGGSKVLLVTDGTFGVAVRLTEQRIRGPAETHAESRTLRLNLNVADVTQDQIDSIERGDDVETCGCDGSEFPPGIPVGEVERVEVQPSQISVEVRIRPLLETASLEHVKVLLWRAGDPVPASLTPTTTVTTTTLAATTTSTTTAGGE
jgi:rod shape-determining protein MreC